FTAWPLLRRVAACDGALSCHGCRLSQKRNGELEMGYSGSDRAAAEFRGLRCPGPAWPPAWAGCQAGETSAAAGRTRHVLVAGPAGGGMHRAGRSGRNVLISARRLDQG